MHTETERKKYRFPMGGRANFHVTHHFSDAPINGTILTKELLDHELPMFSRYAAPVANINLYGPQKDFLL